MPHAPHRSLASLKLSLLSRALLAGAVVALASCGATTSTPDGGVANDDAGAPDAGTGNGGAADAGAPDAGAPDAGAPDAGPADAGEADAGLPSDGGAFDAGLGDAGSDDAGTSSDGGALDAGAGDAGEADAGSVDAGAPDAGPPDAGSTCAISFCAGKVYACGDCIDDDGDQLVDAFDPDCLGACDDTEDSFFQGIPGAAGPACMADCAFDVDTGSGTDDCYWNHKCDPLEVAPAYDPEPWNGNTCAYNLNASTPGTSQTCNQLYAAQSQQCLNTCLPVTPNGCDCFGCCELPAGGGAYVNLNTQDGLGNGTCDLAHASDPTRCAPCTPVPSCLNPCGACEVCIGKSAVPSSCLDAGTVVGQCPGGQAPCGLPGQAFCAAGTACVSGCCQPTF